MTFFRKSLLAVGLAAAALSAQAASVRVWGEDLGNNKNNINNFYDGLAAHDSQIIGGALTAASLTGVSLLWATQPADAYTAGELSVMSAFIAGGGRVAFLGEHGGFAPSQNMNINAALSTLGANISIVNNALSCGFRTASRAQGEINNHPLTDGVDNYQYACFAQLNLGGSAQSLMTGDVGSDGAGISMMAYQNIGAGSVFVITDQNVWDNQPSNWVGFDNARMFENLLTGNTQNNNVPEPASLALVGFALLGAAAARRRKV